MKRATICLFLFVLAGCDEEPECMQQLEDATRSILSGGDGIYLPGEANACVPWSGCGLAEARDCLEDETKCVRDSQSFVPSADIYREQLEWQLQCLESR